MGLINLFKSKRKPKAFEPKASLNNGQEKMNGDFQKSEEKSNDSFMTIEDGKTSSKEEIHSEENSNLKDTHDPEKETGSIDSKSIGIVPEEKKQNNSSYKPRDCIGIVNDIFYFGFSRRGKIHKKYKTRCQDRSLVKASESDNSIIIAAVADGLGSCKYSGTGAKVAIDSSVNYIEEQLAFKKESFADRAIDILKVAMEVANKEVELYALKKGHFVDQYYSTLTIVLYDGNTAYIAHAGDYGI